MEQAGAARDIRRRLLAGFIVLSVIVSPLAYTIAMSERAQIDFERDNSFYMITLALAIGLLTFSDIRIGIAMTILAIGLSPEVVVRGTTFGITNVRMEDFIVPSVFLAWFFRILRNKEKIQQSWIRGPALVYLGATWFATFFGIALGYLFAPDMALLKATKITIYFLIFVVLINCIKTLAELKAFIVFSLLVASISSFVGTSQAYDVQTIEEMRRSGSRVTGPIGETSNVFAGYIAFNLSIIVGLIIHLRSFALRASMLALLGTFTYAMLYTMSRTTYVAILVGVSLFGFAKRIELTFAAIFLMVLFPFFAPESIANRARTISSAVTNPQGTSLGQRYESWETAVYNWTRSPLWGFGMDFVQLGDIDNEYFRILIEAGSIGLIGFLWFLYRIGRLAYQTYDRIQEEPFLKGYMAGYLIAFIVAVIHMMGATSMTTIRTAEHFFVLTAFMVIIANNHREWVATPPSRMRRRDPAEAFVNTP